MQYTLSYNNGEYADEINRLKRAFDRYLVPQLDRNLIDFVFIEGGIFAMGDEYGDLTDDCRPVHNIEISDFYISKLPITQKQYEMVLNSNPSSFINPDHPVERVNWFDSILFCNILSKSYNLHPCYSIETRKYNFDLPNMKSTYDEIVLNPDANGFRLPTEAEWEYAARGGSISQGYKYSGSNYIDDVSWYQVNSLGKTHQVGLKKPNELGIYDMCGLVSEWCWDWYDTKTYYENQDYIPDGHGRVSRGGNWTEIENLCRVAKRGGYLPSYAGSKIGFRIVKSKIKEKSMYNDYELGQYITNAVMLKRNGNYEESLKIYRDLDSHNPNNPMIKKSMAKTQAVAGYFDSALENFKKAYDTYSQIGDEGEEYQCGIHYRKMLDFKNMGYDVSDYEFVNYIRSLSGQNRDTFIMPNKKD